MEQSVYELLRRCTARVSILGKSGHGTGFFVAPGFLLTCAHVVKSAQSPSNEVQVFWNQHPHAARIAKIDFDADLALLHIDLTGHPCVFLTKEALPFDSLYSYGYPDTNPAGDPTTFLLEGKSGDQGERLKFKAGQVRPGQSGAPLLNINSGYVCGIVQLTRGRASDLGGRAIPTTTIFQVFPELEALQRQYHRNDQHWMNSLWAYTTRQTESSDRQQILKKVRATWITGMLEQSLYSTSLIALGLQEKPGVVVNPWHLTVQETERPERLLPPDTSITEIYDSSQGELLILGEPGSGKTTLLLELARELLERARLDNRKSEDQMPIPVYFTLSSWTAEQKPLTDWLIKELNTQYQINPEKGKSWIDEDKLTLLLDGLDEVAPERRDACINALNLYRQTHGKVSVVVCSRKADYLAGTSRMLLRSAVIVQPLTRQQIDDYVSSAAGQLEAVRQALLDDASMQELVETPLMLSVLALAYQGESVENLLAQPSLPARRKKVFEKYVDRVLKHRQVLKRFTPEQTKHWLTWLASQMHKQHQSRFAIELLQPYWLPSKPRTGYRWSVGLVVGSLFGMLIGLFLGWIVGFGAGPHIGLITGLIAGLIVGLIAGIETGQAKEIKFAERITWKGDRSGLLSRLLRGAVLELFSWVPQKQSIKFRTRAPVKFRTILIPGLILGLIFGYGYGEISQPHDGLSSWLIARLSSWPLSSWPIEGLSSWLITELSSSPGEGQIIGLFVGMIILLGVLAIWFLFTVPKKVGKDLQMRMGETVFRLFGGETWKQRIEVQSISPTARLWRYIRNGLFYGLVSGLVFGLVYLPVYELISELRPGLIPVISFGLIAWLDFALGVGLVFMIFGLFFGLFGTIIEGVLSAVIQHTVLRFWLWRADLFPLHVRAFLNEACDRHLLRNIGGNYQFIHLLLRDYFVDLDDTVLPTAGPTATTIVSLPVPISKQEERQTETLTITKQMDQPDPTDKSILAHLRKLEEALTVSEQAIQLDPSNALAYNNKGLALIDLKQYEDALTAIEHALDLDPYYALAYCYKGVALNNLKRYEEALASIEESIRLDPTDVRAHLNKNIVLGKLQRNEEALTASKQALIVADEAIRLNPKDALAYRSKGDALADLKLYEEALTATEEAIRLDPTDARIYHTKGFILINLDRNEEALTATEEAIRLNPTNAISYNNRGVILRNLNRNEGALKAYEWAIRLDPNAALAYNNKGDLLRTLERYEEALVTSEQVIHLDPKDAIAYHNKGIALERLKRYEESLASFEQVIHLDPGFTFAYLGKGNALWNLKRLEEALEAYEQAIRLDSNSALAYHNKGILLKNLKRYEEALTAYEHVIRLDPNNPLRYNEKGLILDVLQQYEGALVAYEEAIRLDPFFVLAYNNKWEVLVNLHRYKEALLLTEQIIRLDPNNTFAYFWKGVTLDYLRRYAEALVVYNQAIRLDPNNMPAYINRGVTLSNLKRFKEALAAYDQVIRLNPGYADAYRRKGDGLSNLARYKRALEAYDQAIRLDPNNSFAHINKGVALSNLKRYEEALEVYDRAIRLDPNDALAYRNKGDVLSYLKQYEGMLGAFEQAIVLDPNSAFAFHCKGVALEKLRRYEEALTAYDQTINLDPNYVHAYRNKGDVLVTLERHEEALMTYEQAIHLDPKYALMYLRKGDVLKVLGRNKEAQVAYSAARALKS